MKKAKRAQLINQLKEKRQEIALMGSDINSKRKLLNIEIDLILLALDLSDEELNKELEESIDNIHFS